MSEDKKEREFQYALTKAQVDFEYVFLLAISLLAILYGLLPYYQDNLSYTIVIDMLICGVFILLIRAYQLKEQRFKSIKKAYINS
jgi:hypothetical protein